MRHGLLRFIAASAVLFGMITLYSPGSQAQNAVESLFKARCAACHGQDGKGEVPMGKKLSVPTFSAPEVQGKSDAQLSDVVTKGKNKMPAYDGKLTKEQIGQLVTYIRELGKKHQVSSPSLNRQTSS